MKAFTKTSLQNEEITETELPIPEITDHEILIKVAAIGVGIHDEYFHPTDVTFPYIIGIEGAGTIEKVGALVTDYSPGDKVAFINAMNPKGGTWAEYTSVPDSALIVQLPKDMRFTEAASLPVVGNTILKAFEALDAQKNDVRTYS